MISRELGAGNRVLIPVILVVVLLFGSCSSKPEFTIWYGVGDQNGIMVAVQRQAAAVVVATIPLSVLQSYREGLAEEGVTSDSLGALQHLFGIPGHHYFRGSAALWDEIIGKLLSLEGIAYETVRPSVEVITRIVIAHAEHLSKDDAPDTLGRLAVAGTEREDIIDALGTLVGKSPIVRVYDAGRFLPTEEMKPAFVRVWMNQWTELILHEAKQTIGVGKDVR